MKLIVTLLACGFLIALVRSFTISD